MMLCDVSRLENRIIPHVLDFQAEQNGDAVWLWSGERKLTFAACGRLSRQYAASLAAMGVAKGNVVLMVMTPSIEAILVSMAAARLGAIFMTINTDYHGAFLEEAIAQSTAAVLVIDAPLAERLEKIDLKQLQHVIVHGDATPRVARPVRSLASLLDNDGLLPSTNVAWNDPVQVWWSSGTTGKSKGVMHGHSSLLRAPYVRGIEGKVLPGDVFYSCTPIYLGSPWTGTIWPSLVNGVTAAIDASFSVSQFWDRIRYYGATSFFTLGAMHMHLWKLPPSPHDKDHRLRSALAIPLTWEQIAEFKARYGISEMSQAYGTSETFQIFSAPDGEGERFRGAAMGRATSHMTVKLLNETGIEVPMGEVGEICVRPDEPGTMFLGYFEDPAMTLSAWRDLWHHTGDMAMRDEDGVYYFADRKKDYIRYNGRNISMFEVEAVVDRHPDVADVTAYGITSAEMESEAELMLAVVCKAGKAPTANDIARYINENAPYYFVPRYIAFIDALPRNAHGRVMKHLLRDKGLPTDAWDRKTSGFVVKR